MIPAQYRVVAAAGAALVGMLLAGAAGWFANGWRHDAVIAELRRAQTEYRATLTEAALADVQANAAVIRQAATEFGAIRSTLAPTIAALTKELRNVRTATPLPADCKPTPDRVHNLDAAIDAANKSIPR